MNGFDLRFFRWASSGNETPSTSNNNHSNGDSCGKHRTVVENADRNQFSRSTSRSVGSSFWHGDQGHKLGPSRSTSTSGRSLSRSRDESADRSTGRHRSGSTSRRGETSEGSSGHGRRSASTLRRDQHQAAEGSLGRSTSTRPRSASALRREETSEGFLGRSTSTRPRSVSTLRRQEASEGSGGGISRCRSTFILKAPTVERDIECTLEELYHGCVKKIQVSRTVIRSEGAMIQEQEKLKINVKPGWRTGTKITFEGKGDERPGTLPADLVFAIVEKQHPLFKRERNDLILTREVPLVKALTGCSLSIPLISGEKMNIALKEIIRPGFEMILKGQGMPDVKEERTRGDLKVQFQVKFPARLKKEQQKEIKELLQGISFT